MLQLLLPTHSLARKLSHLSFCRFIVAYWGHFTTSKPLTDNKPRPNWSGFMQTNSPSSLCLKPTITFLPILDHSPTDPSCIYSITPPYCWSVNKQSTCSYQWHASHLTNHSGSKQWKLWKRSPSLLLVD